MGSQSFRLLLLVANVLVMLSFVYFGLEASSGEALEWHNLAAFSEIEICKLNVVLEYLFLLLFPSPLID